MKRLTRTGGPFLQLKLTGMSEITSAVIVERPLLHHFYPTLNDGVMIHVLDSVFAFFIYFLAFGIPSILKGHGAPWSTSFNSRTQVSF